MHPLYILILTRSKLVIASAFRERSPHEPPGDLSKEAIAKCPVRFLFGGYRDDGHAFPETIRPV